jgi:hypothetical protein
MLKYVGKKKVGVGKYFLLFMRDFEAEILSLTLSLTGSLCSPAEPQLMLDILALLQLHRDLIVVSHAKRALASDAKLTLDAKILSSQNLNYK